ncbi:30S ribosomal protein S1 [bioreactor metagenome]|uniref:30S ribosomal protein S1 n=1 Tax=bioreactor metagenome TaxID=1076179 RepID=A0A644T6C5_9ZZZZ|nr:S1 RNA-binding domain-containing protein [Candidatus Elulimicrobiales bacterium]
MENTTTKNTVVLDQYTKMVLEPIPQIKQDDIVEGPVLAITNTAVYIDLGPIGTGIIYGIEYINARDLIKKINIGDLISAKVIEKEDKNGYIDLSLREAKHALIWSEAEVFLKEKRVLSLVAKEANKGGLIMDWNGINGFLPSSQLKGENYPKVEDGAKDQILNELRKLVGKRIPVTIIAAIPKEGKLIFSESTDPVLEDGELREAKKKDDTVKDTKTLTKIISKYNLGDQLEGVVTGVVDFGIFVKIDNEIEGLIHKSEIDWGLVENTKDYAKVGDTVKVEVIEIKDNKISLSMKKLKENPWISASKKYNKGDVVDGVVIRFNKHGALVSIEEGVAGLIHISDFENEEKMKEALSLGKIYKFEITLFDGKDEKMTLTLKK